MLLFLFSFFFLSVLCSHVQPPHTHFTAYHHITLAVLNSQPLSCCLSPHLLLFPYFVLLPLPFFLSPALLYTPFSSFCSYATMLSKYSYEDPETITRSSINCSCSSRSHTTSYQSLIKFQSLKRQTGFFFSFFFFPCRSPCLLFLQSHFELLNIYNSGTSINLCMLFQRSKQK